MMRRLAWRGQARCMQICKLGTWIDASTCVVQGWSARESLLRPVRLSRQQGVWPRGTPSHTSAGLRLAARIVISGTRVIKPANRLLPQNGCEEEPFV